MALTHQTAARNAMADAIDDTVNAGVTDAGGDLVWIQSTPTPATDVAAFLLSDPAFGAAAGGTISLAGVTLTSTAAATGTVDKFEVRDKDNNVVFSGSIATTGADFNVDNTVINSGQTTKTTSFDWNAPS